MRQLADIQSPWNHLARRFIEPPVYRFEPHKLANFWRLEIRQDGQRFVVENDKPVLDAAPVWDKIHIGTWAQCNIAEFEKPNGWCVNVRKMGASLPGFSMIGLIARAPDWVDRVEAPLDYRASVLKNVDWFDGHEKNPNAYYREPGMPAWWWHACEMHNPTKEPFQDGSFPSLASQGIRAMLFAARILPERAESCRRQARAIGDWLIKNRTPMTGKVPGMPYSAMADGKFNYSTDGDAVNLTRGALPGYMMVLLYQETGDKKYLDYAQHMANVYVQWLRPDGSLPYRVKADTGEVLEEYTCGNMLVGIFLDALDKLAPDQRWRDAVEQIVQWTCAHPAKDLHWKACFEDVGGYAAFANLSSMDALWGVRLLCRHGHLPEALKTMRFVEDQFVNFGDEASLCLQTYYPCVREQWHCDYPMECHSSHYIGSCWELFEATGDVTWRNKAVTTQNAIVTMQRADGAYSTWGIDRFTGVGSLSSGGNWFNTNHGAMLELAAAVLRQRGETFLPY